MEERKEAAVAQEQLGNRDQMLELLTAVSGMEEPVKTNVIGKLLAFAMGMVAATNRAQKKE